MPLYALDPKDHIVAAVDAAPFRPYRCLECKAAVHLRSGPLRQPHFVHRSAMPSCRLHSRGFDHFAIQITLQAQNPALIIERPFPKILRIADLCWEERRLIFEIQCSLIDTIDAMTRINDYRKEGYEVLWLLDDRLYNKKKALRSGEAFLRSHSCYYFSLSRQIIYDQLEVSINQFRLARGPSLPTLLTTPLPIPLSHPHWTEQLDQRTGPYFFPGDLVDRVLRHPNYLKTLQEHEQAVRKEYAENNRSFSFLKKNLFIGLEYLLRQYSTQGR